MDKNLPTFDSVPDDDEDEPVFTKGDFERALRKTSRPSKEDEDKKD